MRPVSDELFMHLMAMLEAVLPARVSLSGEFKQMLRSMLFEGNYKRGSRILNFKQKQHMAWFMLEGMAREIVINPLTFEEHTVWFWFAGSFLYTSPGFFSQQESLSTIEIVQDCKTVWISYPDWVELKKAFPQMETLTEQVRGDFDKKVQDLTNDIRYLSTELRYEKYKPQLNKLFGQTKLRYVAEYLGMSADRLGKLRKSC